MEAASKYRRYRKGVTSPTSTTVHGCKAECLDLLPSRTDQHYCFFCHNNVGNSTLEHEKSRENCGIRCPVKKIGTKLFKLGHPNKNGNLLGRSSSTSVVFSSVLPTRYDKRAVLCGVSYTKRKFRLKGTINDIRNMKELLIKKFKFPNECIRVLTEQEHDANLIPTKHNILESLRWLVKECQPGDSLVFYFSGHGLQQPDFKEDEIDGFDETLCPVDFMKEGMITDNEINSTIVWPLKKGVILHAIVDACHSGTILDLLHVYNYERGIWEDNKPPSKEPIRKHTSGGLAISLSACEDSQTASDSTVFGGKGMNGVLTYLFTKTVRECPEITYGRLLEKIHDEIKKLNQRRCHNRILQNVFHCKIAQMFSPSFSVHDNKQRGIIIYDEAEYILQDPLLSSSEKFDVSTTVFKL